MRKHALAGVALACAVGLASVAPAAANDNTKKLREAVTVDGIRSHLVEFQNIANANGGNREASSTGYQASVDYVKNKLTAAGYNVTVQPFTYAYYELLDEAVLTQNAPTPAPTYEFLEDFFVLDYSAPGTVSGLVQAVDLKLPSTGGSTSGCEAADFAGFVPGRIALVQRGSCNFSVKVANAAAADAIGIIIFNEGNTPDREPVFGGNGENPLPIPALTASFQTGVALNNLIASGLNVTIQTETFSEFRQSSNVIADSKKGRTDEVVVVGAHLDSVAEGPGINDNGSGTATILEIALQMAKLNINPKNQVRFAFWGAEEAGLVGAQYYVDNLSEAELANIAVNLNFDMLGSVNYVRFVYDGDGSDSEAGPAGSDYVEGVFNDYFSRLGLATEPTAFDGRSDYGPFIDVGIPAGGLFSGAEGVKTPEQVAIYGGTAGEWYDPCYHQVCDTINNVSNKALDELGDAAAHAVEYFVTTPSPFKERGKSSQAKKYGEYKGPKLVK
jgi:Zn-dependent M28 family amino/carboxypeptidase